MTHLTWNHPFIATISEQGAHECITRGAGVSDSWLDVRKRGGVIQMRTVCNRGGGGN